MESNKSSVSSWITQVIMFVVGVGLVYWVFKNSDWEQLKEAFAKANYWWAIPVLIASLIGHYVRALRWNLLLNGMNYFPKPLISFSALMTGYMVSYAVPRVGEFSRCYLVQKKEKIPFSALLGTVVAERIVDMVCLLILIGSVMLLEGDVVGSFFNDKIFSPLGSKVTAWGWKGIVGIIAAIVLIFYLFSSFMKKEEKKEKEGEFLEKLTQGMLAFKNVPKPILFYSYTVIIWAMYFLFTYLWIFAFEESSGLNLSEGLAVMVLSSLSKMVPLQAGAAGAFHFVFSESIQLFGVTAVCGLALATIVHGTQMVYSVLLGAICYVYLILVKDREVVLEEPR